MAEIDMVTVVLIGNSTTYLDHGHFVTPRRYEEKETYGGIGGNRPLRKMGPKIARQRAG